MERPEVPGFMFFSPKTQFENVGDALINRQLILGVAEHFRLMVDLSRCPSQFVETMDLSRNGKDNGITFTESKMSFIWAMLLCSVRRRKAYYLLSPGGYFGEKSYGSALVALCYTFFLIFISSLGIKIVHYGVSYERLGSRHAALLRFRAHILYRHIVRDAESFAYATSRGIRVDGIGPDLAFGLEPSCRSDGGDGVALSFRSDQYLSQQAEVMNLVRQLAEHVPSTRIFLVCQVERDRTLMEHISSVLGEGAKFVDATNSIDCCVQAYSQCRYVLSNRLHALIIGNISGAIPVAIVDDVYNAKIVGLFRTNGLSDQLAPANSTTSKEILAKLAADRVKGFDVSGLRLKLRDALSKLV